MRKLEQLSNTIFGVAMTLLAYDLPKAAQFDHLPDWHDLYHAFGGRLAGMVAELHHRRRVLDQPSPAADAPADGQPRHRHAEPAVPAVDHPAAGDQRPLRQLRHERRGRRALRPASHRDRGPQRAACGGSRWGPAIIPNCWPRRFRCWCSFRARSSPRSSRATRCISGCSPSSGLWCAGSRARATRRRRSRLRQRRTRNVAPDLPDLVHRAGIDALQLARGVDRRILIGAIQHIEIRATAPWSRQTGRR